MAQNKMTIRKGDTVKVITGKDRGKTGKVLRSVPEKSRVVVEKVKSLPAGEGLNCANGEYGNMIEMGVNDPVKVTRTALQSAASVAALILITEATINEIPKDGPDLSALAGAMGGGGGMY